MKGILTDNRAQGASASKAVSLVVFLAVLTLVGAVLVPVAIDAIESDDSVTETTGVGNTTEINGELNATLDSTNTGTNATYTLQTDSQSITKTIAVNGNATYAFDRGDVDVNVSEATSTNATATYTYPTDFAYSSGASALWALLGLAIVLTLFLYTVRAALDF